MRRARRRVHFASETKLDEPRETHQEINNYGRQIRIPSTLIGLTVPFDGEQSMFYVRPSFSRP
jgi:hypothetical protein